MNAQLAHCAEQAAHWEEWPSQVSQFLAEQPVGQWDAPAGGTAQAAPLRCLLCYCFPCLCYSAWHGSTLHACLQAADHASWT